MNNFPSNFAILLLGLIVLFQECYIFRKRFKILITNNLTSKQQGHRY